MMINYYDYLMIILSVLSGVLIGNQRQRSGHPEAGRRTLALISMGSCIFTMMPSLTKVPGDVWRMAANVITGIGFLGAGVLFKDGSMIKGLTTASSIWVSAGIGIAFGCQEVLLGTFVTLVAYIILIVKPGHQ